MSNNQNLESLYNSELKPRLTELNNQRADIVNKIKKFALYSIVPIIISIFVSIEIQFPIPTIIVVGLSVLISFFKINPLWKEYYKQFKEQVIREIIRFIDDGLSFLSETIKKRIVGVLSDWSSDNKNVVIWMTSSEKDCKWSDSTWELTLDNFEPFEFKSDFEIIM